MTTRKEVYEFVDETTGRRPEAFREFLDALADSAQATGEHVRDDWQDERAARAWEKISDVIAKASEKIRTLEPF